MTCKIQQLIVQNYHHGYPQKKTDVKENEKKKELNQPKLKPIKTTNQKKIQWRLITLF